jgi:hypothetical protein
MKKKKNIGYGGGENVMAIMAVNINEKKKSWLKRQILMAKKATWRQYSALASAAACRHRLWRQALN